MKKRIFYLAFSLLTVISINAVVSTSQEKDADEEKATNLKVLPNDISNDHLEAIMDAFNESLGVKCGFCHALRKDGGRGLDFASDDNPKKEAARFMLKMTNEINENYFKDYKRDGMHLQVSCATCHNGQVHPKMREIK